MERYLSNPNVDKTVVNTIQVYEGGTGGITVDEAQQNLDILDKGTVGAPNGLAIMPANGLFGGSIEGGVDDKPMIDGPKFVRTNQTNKFFITNYDIKTDYAVSSSMGQIHREEDYLIFKSGPDAGVATIKVNNLEVQLDIFLALINMPDIVYPPSGADDINSKVEVKTTEFITGEVNTFHAYTDWQLSTTVEMDNIFKAVEKSANFLTNWKVEGLQENVTYYIRFRYWDNVGNKSSWSEITQFKTRVTFAPEKPFIVSPPNGTDELKADVNFTSSDLFTYEDVTHVSSDWQFSTSSVFAGLFLESEADETNLTSWTVGGLNTSTLYYVRVRHTDSRGRKSDWSDPSRIRTRKSFAAETPFIINPGNSTDGHNSRVGIASSVFSGGDSRVTHQSSDWEISEDTSFQYPYVKSYSNSNDKTYWVAKKLKSATTYYARVRYRDTMGYVTDWSKPIQFKTKDSFNPSRPTVTEPNNAKTDVGPWLAMRSAAYVSNNEGDIHLNSDWEIGSSISFSDLVKWNTAADNDKITWTVKGLEEGSQYFVRIRHRSSIDGEEFVSDWSSPVSFSTKVSFAPGKPTITYPRSGAKDVSENINITSTNYLPSDSQDVHVNSDWEISTNSGFTDIVQSNYGSAVAKTLWQVTNMRSLTTFFVRVRHRTINDGIYYVSDWSSTNNFTVEHTAPATPVILTPSNGSDKVDTNPLITSSAYLAGEVEEKHFASSWQIASDSQFTDIVLSLQSSSTNKVSWQVEGLENSKNYYVRVKHIGSLGFESAWSTGSQFTTKAAIVSQAPKILKPTEGAVNVDPEVSITSSSFATSEPSDSHLSSDWEISLESSFTNVIKSEYNSMVSKTSWAPGKLLNQTIYYVRVRHKGSLSGPTGWSTASSFTTKAAAYNQAPSIVSPANNATGVVTAIEITSSVFASSDTSDTHLSSDWQLSTSPTFATLANSVTGSLVNKTKWAPGGLQENTSYYVRVRHTGSVTGPTGWSTTSSFKTKAPDVIGQVAKPSITEPTSGTTGLNTSFIVKGSAFSSSVGGDSHKASDWEVATDIGFGAVVKSSYDSTVSKTSWSVGALTVDTTYYLRVRYKGNTGGNSPWSDVVNVKTKVDTGGSEIVTTPTITSPPAGSSQGISAITITSSSFGSSSTSSTHQSSDWELSTNSAFTTIVKSSYDTAAELTSWGITNLTAGTTYYVRVKHTSSSGKDSAWSNTVSFSTTTVSVPGANGIVKYDIASQFVFLGAYPTNWSVIFSKNTDLFSTHSSYSTWGGEYDGSAYTGHSYLKRHEVKSDGTFNTEVIRAAMTMSSVSGTSITSVNGAWSTSDKSKQAYYGVITALVGQYGESLPSATFLVGDGAGTGYYGGVSTDKAYAPPDGKLPTDPGATGAYNTQFISAIDVNDTFDTIVYSWGASIYQMNNTVKIKYSLQADDGSRTGLFSGPLEIPAGSIPTGFGWMVGISGNGNVVFVHSGSNWVYIYQRDNTGVNWAFVEKIQLPTDAFFFEISETGDKMVVGNKTWFACTVVSKKNGSWNNFTLIEPIGSVQIPSTYFVRGTRCSISKDGTVVSVGVVKEKGFEVHFYREQPDGSWGSVKVIQLPIPDIGTLSSFDVNHKLSFDGTTCMMMEPNYTVSASSGIGAPVPFHGKVCLAY